MVWDDIVVIVLEATDCAGEMFPELFKEGGSFKDLLESSLRAPRHLLESLLNDDCVGERGEFVWCREVFKLRYVRFFWTGFFGVMLALLDCASSPLDCSSKLMGDLVLLSESPWITGSISMSDVWTSKMGLLPTWMPWDDNCDGFFVMLGSIFTRFCCAVWMLRSLVIAVNLTLFASFVLNFLDDVEATGRNSARWQEEDLLTEVTELSREVDGSSRSLILELCKAFFCFPFLINTGKRHFRVFFVTDSMRLADDLKSCNVRWTQWKN